MKKYLSVLCFSALVLISACKNNPQYKIIGTASNELEGKTVYLKKLENMIPVDEVINSAVVVNGKFEMKGFVEHPDFYNLSVAQTRQSLNFIVENENITVNIDENRQNNFAKGSPLNNLYADYLKEIRGYQTRSQEILKQAEEARKSGKTNYDTEKMVNERYDIVMKEYKNYQLGFIKKHPNNIVSAYVLRTISNTLSPEEIESNLSKFDSVLIKTDFIRVIKTELENIKKTAVGQNYMDIKGHEPEQYTKIALSNYVGKSDYVLVYFWAAWNDRCRAENPMIAALYNLYHKNGLEILGVSIDRNYEQWDKAIKEDKLAWPQLSNLKGWECAEVDDYHINAIPNNVLIDKEGKIIAKNLSIGELEKKLETLFGF